MKKKTMFTQRMRFNTPFHSSKVFLQERWQIIQVFQATYFKLPYTKLSTKVPKNVDNVMPRGRKGIEQVSFLLVMREAIFLLAISLALYHNIR